MSESEKTNVNEDFGSSDCYPSVVCVQHRFQSHRRSRCPYCDLEAGIHLAIGSRNNASGLADIIREQNRGAAETLDHLADNFDRLGEIIQTIKGIKEATI